MKSLWSALGHTETKQYQSAIHEFRMNVTMLQDIVALREQDWPPASGHPEAPAECFPEMQHLWAGCAAPGKGNVDRCDAASPQTMQAAHASRMWLCTSWVGGHFLLMLPSLDSTSISTNHWCTSNTSGSGLPTKVLGFA